MDQLLQDLRCGVRALAQARGLTIASPATYQHWREQTRVVQDVAAFRNNVVNFTGGGVPEQLRAGEVSAEQLVEAPVRVRAGRHRKDDVVERRSAYGDPVIALRYQ